jgi:ribosome-associated heat shock protein Hsp15
MARDDSGDSVRLDKWLWAARFYKTRALAAEAIDAGRVEVNDERAKRARPVAIGDKVRIRKPPFEQQVTVRALSDVRGPAPVAATLYEESAESREARDALARQLRLVGPPAFEGRPSKKDRRLIDRWRRRDA